MGDGLRMEDGDGTPELTLLEKPRFVVSRAERYHEPERHHEILRTRMWEGGWKMEDGDGTKILEKSRFVKIKICGEPHRTIS